MCKQAFIIIEKQLSTLLEQRSNNKYIQQIFSFLTFFWQYWTYFSHVWWSEDSGDDENVTNDASNDDQSVKSWQQIHRKIRNCLIVNNVLEKNMSFRD